MDTEEPPLPPAPELLNRQPKWFKPVFYGFIVASLLLAIAFLIAPLFIRQRGHDPWEEGFKNARQLGIVLYEFESDFGAFPDESTVSQVKAEFDTDIHLNGMSSNALFRQLFTTGIVQTERIFHAGINRNNRPDENIVSRHILEPGECEMSYIAGLSFEDDPLTPIVLTPLIPGTTKFDPKPFNGKAIILHIDNSVRTYDIAKDSHIYDAKGINLLSPKNPIWKGKAPDIRYPE
ncbi:MAG: hypothetical protein RLZZ505_1101 [Verrucomicrobiota bacterium]|jgi:hypothetical protein